MGKRKPITQKIRFEVFKRDCFTCQYCGSKAPDIVLNVDHITPVAKGGTNDITNLVTSCFDCNSGKKDRLLSEHNEVERQMHQLRLIQEKRNQLEMIKQWRDECISYETDLVSIVEAVFQGCASTRPLNDHERLVLKKAIKKFGLDICIEASEIAAEQYEDVSDAIAKLGGISMNLKRESEMPGLGKVSLIKCILRKNNVCFKDWQLHSLFEEALKLNVDVDSVVKLAGACNRWNDFAIPMRRFIEEQNANG